MRDALLYFRVPPGEIGRLQTIPELEEKLASLDVDPEGRLEKVAKYTELLQRNPPPSVGAAHRESISYYKKTLVIPELGDIVLWSGWESGYLLLITEVNMDLKKKSYFKGVILHQKNFTSGGISPSILKKRSDVYIFDYPRLVKVFPKELNRYRQYEVLKLEPYESERKSPKTTRKDLPDIKEVVTEKGKDLPKNKISYEVLSLNYVLLSFSRYASDKMLTNLVGNLNEKYIELALASFVKGSEIENYRDVEKNLNKFYREKNYPKLKQYLADLRTSGEEFALGDVIIFDVSHAKKSWLFDLLEAVDDILNTNEIQTMITLSLFGQDIYHDVLLIKY